MKTEQLISIMPRHSGDYRSGWAVAFLLAFLASPFVVIYQHNVPWLIVIPIVFGAASIFFLEWKFSEIAKFESEHFESTPEGFKGMQSYEHLLALEVHPPRKASKGQLALFPAFPETTPINSIRTLRDNDGKVISAVKCDRYSALLITYLLENLDNATEKSLRAGLARFGEMGKGKSDIQMFVHDKTIREAIKADFRGNLVALVSKGGEKIIKDLLKAADAIEKEKEEREKIEIASQAEAFKLK